MKYLKAAAATLSTLPGIDLAAYGAQLLQRFSNPHIAHETFQIAMDGTEKLPQRIFAPARETLQRGGDLRPFAFATAAWMRHASRSTHDCPPYDLRDPRAAEIASALAGTSTAEGVARVLCGLPDFMPAELATLPGWKAVLADILGVMLTDGMSAAIADELAA